MRLSLGIGVAVLLLTMVVDGAPNPLFVVIVNKQNPMTSLSSQKVKTIFLKRISRWPWGAEIRPVYLPDRLPVHREFVKDVLGTTSTELEVYWIDQKATRNVSAPQTAPSAEAVRAIVASQLGAIGYIPATDVDGSVRVLEVVP